MKGWLKPVTYLKSREYLMHNSISDQAFSPSYDLAPSPSPPLSKQVVSLSQSSCVSPVSLLVEEGGRRGGGVAKSYDGEEAWPSIIH